MIKEILLTGPFRELLFSNVIGNITEWLVESGWIKPGEVVKLSTFLNLFVHGMWDLKHPKAQPPHPARPKASNYRPLK